MRWDSVQPHQHTTCLFHNRHPEYSLWHLPIEGQGISDRQARNDRSYADSQGGSARLRRWEDGSFPVCTRGIVYHFRTRNWDRDEGLDVFLYS